MPDNKSPLPSASIKTKQHLAQDIGPHLTKVV